jgi:hypothetical protein
MDALDTVLPDHVLALLRGMPDPDTVREIEAPLLDLPQVDLQTTMIVHGGMCIRTILIPAGTLLTGAQTNLDNLCTVSGDIVVTTDQGPQRLTGYHVLPAAKGYKRAGVALADTYWSTIWRTDLDNLQAIEDEMTDEAHMLQTRRAVIEHETREVLA